MTVSATTEGLEVEAEAFFVPERSAPERGHYHFGYRIRITNRSTTKLQLLSRHWMIQDGEGAIQEVRGLGVVGEQPVVAPGETFEYTSSCPLRTPMGSMRGTYEIAREGGGSFTAEIPEFVLIHRESMN